MSDSPLLAVSGLSVDFDTPDGPLRAVDDLSFEVFPGQVVGIVGESGSGKSVTSRAIMRMVRSPGRITEGRIQYDGRDLTSLSESEMRQIRGRDIAMIFQDPQATLNPVMRIGDQIEEAVRIHGGSQTSARDRAIELLTQVGITDPTEAAEKYPHEFSGGMRQRVVIAIALANRPSLLIADEPTTALDVTIQAQILDLLRDLRRDLGIAIVFITHDMGVVAEMCDEVIVMLRGKAVERGPVEHVLHNPQHPYTIGLMDAVPSMDEPLRPTQATVTPALKITDLRTDLGKPGGLLRKPKPFFAVDGVSLQLSPGETLGLVGESGCGKSTLSRTIVGIAPVSSGSIEVAGRDVTAMRADDRAHVAASIQYVFQDPFASLNPRRTIGQSLEEALQVAGVPKSQWRSESVRLLERVGLLETHLDRYPYAFSGGQRQRVGIARALASNPQLLILDEPVSALDVSIQAQILDLLVKLQEELGVGYLFISHDLSVVRGISHRVAVMLKGKIVEQGTTEEIFDAPQHPYTKKLLASTPSLVGGEAA
ncbi:ABC transporter permease [Pseudoclavibacter endophyticus]|uniref:ABC transporter ATP-binding protein n=1 Tax=Pseudoclavibacter endophyticus TaxID=1778590 RepID=A0A6H9WMA2_9MICO|nr:ABC transporter ATP-binding protein [Pseudoclavibacter endophyticus]KAB1649138.1 ABC transporter ATP-binding protein [Pseudoclavibacter endophyticus]GGA65105.1 ABC transporter permease [Pseudoclavibacter endophyticus]